MIDLILYGVIALGGHAFIKERSYQKKKDQEELISKLKKELKDQEASL